MMTSITNIGRYLGKKGYEMRDFKAKEAVKLKNTYWDKVNDHCVVFEDLAPIYSKISYLANKGEESVTLSSPELPKYFYHDEYAKSLVESGKQEQLNRMIKRKEILLSILSGNGYVVSTFENSSTDWHFQNKLIIKW